MNKKEILIPRLLFIFLLFLVAMSYSNSLYSPFILDDLSAFINNPNMYLQDLSLDSLSQLLHTRFGKARLLPIFTFAMDHYLGKGQSMAYYHATSIIIHLFATAALALFITALLKTKGAENLLVFFRPAYFALAVCGLWALAPVQTNAVTYLVQRMTSLMALFYLAACAFYIYARLARQFWPRIILWGVFLMAAAGAFFSKENSATLPVAILLIEGMFVAPGSLARTIRARRWYQWFIFVAVLILVFPLIQYKLEAVMSGFPGRHFTLAERLLTQPRIVVFYISLLLLPWPGRMNLDHDFSLSTSLVSPPSTILALCLLLGLLFLGFIARKKQPFIAFGIFWFYLNLVIESSIVPLELIFEHRLYLPSAGFFLVILSVVDNLLGKHGRHFHPEIKKIVFLVFLVVISVSSLLTTSRNYDWRDRVALYRDSYEKSPAKSRAATNYAMALGRAERYDECVEYGLLAQTIGQQGYEDYMNSATNTLTCLLIQEKYEEAAATGERIRSKILAKNMGFINAGGLEKYMFNMGRAYAETGEYRKALETYQVSLFRKPDQPDVFLAINKLILAAQQEEEGRQILEIGEEKHEIPIYLARLAIKYRQYMRSARYLQDAQTLEVETDETLAVAEKLKNNMDKNRHRRTESNIVNNETYAQNSSFRLYLKSFDFIVKNYWPLQDGFAGWLLMQARSIDPVNPFLPVYQAKWHMVNKRLDEAIAILEEYVDNDDNFIPVLQQLGLCYRRKGNYPEALAIYRKILDLYPGTPKWRDYLSYIYENDELVEDSTRTPLDYY